MGRNIAIVMVVGLGVLGSIAIMAIVCKINGDLLTTIVSIIGFVLGAGSGGAGTYAYMKRAGKQSAK